ncbi:MAG TPA: TolC family protein, partial [Candidatus Sulfotelmatobacter sp.]|nr:TolC family protein [Candidatus Sulfotelmatobacter sp.]
AYDPTLELIGDAAHSTQPSNSTTPSTLSYPIAPDTRSSQVGANLRQYIGTGGALTVRANGLRQTSEGAIALINPAYGAQVGAEFRQPLLRGRATDPARLAMNVATADRERAESSLEGDLNATLAGVERAYWVLVAARQVVSVREEAVALAQEQLDETRTRIEGGAAPATELAQPRAELERRRADLLAARENLSRADNQLKLLIFRDDDSQPWGDTIAPADTGVVDSVTLDRDALMKQALAARPELGAFSALVTRREAESRGAEDQEWPQLDAVLSYDRYGVAGSANPFSALGPLPSVLDGDLSDAFHMLGEGGYNAFHVGVSLGLPIGNREARGASAAARAVEEQAQADLARARKTIRVEVLDACAAVETATRRIEATRAAREAAEVQLSAEKDRYQTGLSINFLVLTRQNDLSSARLDEISARTEYLTARTELLRATGTLSGLRGINSSEIGGMR